MKTFKDFITEETLKHEVTDLPHGGKIYSQRINSHMVQTHFYPNGEDGHYDVHFIRHTDGSPSDSFSRRGIGSMDIDDRLKALSSIKKASKDFITNNKPLSLTSKAATDKKADWSEEMLQRLSNSHGGKVVRSGNEVSLVFNRRS